MIARLFLLFASLLLVGCDRGVLPGKRELLALSESEVRTLVLSYAPTGTARGDVERTLRRDFRKDWAVIDYEAPRLMSKMGFSVPVAGEDYYFTSDFAVAMDSLVSSDVLTVYFLFDARDTLKDVAVRKWHDAI